MLDMERFFCEKYSALIITISVSFISSVFIFGFTMVVKN